MIKFIIISLLAAFSFISSINAQIQVGDIAQSFELKNVDGKMVSLENLPKAEKGIILIFTCNHCPYSVKYEDRIIELDKKYSPKGFPVLAINSNDPISYPDDSYENMIKRHKKKKFTFPYVFDETQQVAKTYGAEKTPHVYLLQKNADGKYTVKYIGAIDDNPENSKAVKIKYVENAIEELIAGKEISTKQTKAIGCSIKWRKN